MAAPLPEAAAGKKLVDGYGGGAISIRGETFRKPIVLLADRVIGWNFADIAALTAADFQALIDLPARPSILLIGMGKRALFVRPDVRRALRDAGMVADLMDTGAACRTYNLLLAEERSVGACLVPV
ncbi:MAG: Mth938-like domain-containing protein [Tagaea sp.]